MIGERRRRGRRRGRLRRKRCRLGDEKRFEGRKKIPIQGSPWFFTSDD